MHRAHRFMVSLLLASALAAPVVIMAAPAPQVAIQLRVYDRQHRDYHNWDDREDRAYRGYLVEHHQTYRVYNKQNRRTQDRYWAWRHSREGRD